MLYVGLLLLGRALSHHIPSLASGLLYPVALVICLAIQLHGSPASMDPILLQVVVRVTSLQTRREAMLITARNRA